MTAIEFHTKSPDFAAFMAHWREDRRCPFPLPDFLLEHDLPGPAAFALWALNEPDRPVALPTEYGERRGTCGPFPAATRHCWYWAVREMRAGMPLTPHHVPRAQLTYSASPALPRGATEIDALLTIMDRWRITPCLCPTDAPALCSSW